MRRVSVGIMVAFAILIPVLCSLALIVADRLIRRHYDRQLAHLLARHDARSRAQLARFHAEWGCDGSCTH